MEFYKQPEPVGYWELVPMPQAFRIATHFKPKWLHRKMIHLCFGWTWHDGKLY